MINYLFKILTFKFTSFWRQFAPLTSTPLSKYTELIFDIDKSIHELDDPKLATELRLDLFSLLVG